MGETIDDFIRRFGGEAEGEEERASQAERFYDKFVSKKPEDEEFDPQALHEGATEYLGKLPDDQFREAASQSYSQMEPRERQGLLGSLLGALRGSGVDLESIARSLGLSQTDPDKMDPDDYARLADYTRREHPEAMRQVMADKPWYLKALGNPVVLGALGMIAAHWLRGKREEPR